MTKQDIANLRLYNQCLSHQKSISIIEAVEKMGALQAQHYEMAKWAVGMRAPGSTREQIEQSIAKGELIRMHLLRPTWHFIAANDLRWMLGLTAPRIKTAMHSRHKQLGITDKVAAKSNAVIKRALHGGKQLLRKDLITKLEAAGLKNKDNKGAHLLLRAEMDGIICSGASDGKTHTYALLDDRIPKTKNLNRDQALAGLARTYFKSRGPATLDDFIWWSGLKITDARNALEIIEKEFVSEKVDSKIYWLPPKSANVSEDVETSAYLLPAYDEFLISYKDRSAVITDENHKKAVSKNGIFYPVIVLNGCIAGIWKRTLNKKSVKIELMPFSLLTKTALKAINHEAQRYGFFLGKEVILA